MSDTIKTQLSTKEKIELLRNEMKKKNIDYYVIFTSDPHGSEYVDECFRTREYFTGFTGSAGTLVVSNEEAALFVDGRYHIQAEEETDNDVINVYKLGEKDIPNYLEYLSSKMEDGEWLAFDGKVVTAEKYFAIEEELGDYINIDYSFDPVNEIWQDRKKQSCEKVYIIDEAVSGRKTEDKINDVRQYIKDYGVYGVFLSELSDIMWLYNIRGNDIENSPLAFSYSFITEDTAILYLQKSSYDERIIKHFEEMGVYIADYDEIEIELSKLKGKEIIVDEESTSCLFYKILECGNDVITDYNYNFIKKHIKNNIEINMAKHYSVIDAVSVIKFIIEMEKRVSNKEKINEYEAAMLLDNYRKNNEGFVSLSFDTICAYKENAAIVHYCAKKDDCKQIENKGMLLVDSGAQYMGATTDITRTIVLGELTEEEKKYYTLVLKGNLRLMDTVFRKGVRCENLDVIAREPLWREMSDYRHGTGHGIGAFLNVHEGPYSIKYNITEEIEPVIENGMIISDEPGFYKENSFGIRHETQLVCVSAGESTYGEFMRFEPLSLVPFDTAAIIMELLNEDEKDILNRYHKLCYEKVAPLLSENEKIWLKNATKEI